MGSLIQTSDCTQTGQWLTSCTSLRWCFRKLRIIWMFPSFSLRILSSPLQSRVSPAVTLRIVLDTECWCSWRWRRWGMRFQILSGRWEQSMTFWRCTALWSTHPWRFVRVSFVICPKSWFFPRGVSSTLLLTWQLASSSQMLFHHSRK